MLLGSVSSRYLMDRSDGCLTVAAHQEGSTVTLSIADNGPGLSENYSETAQPGFGMTLVNALADQIDGTIRFEKDNGVEARSIQ